MIKGIEEVWESFVVAVTNLAHGKKGYGNSHSTSHLPLDDEGLGQFTRSVKEHDGIHGVGTGVSRK